MTGHLDASNTNQTANDISTAIGGFMTLLSAFYFFEHSLLEVKDDLKNAIWVSDTKSVSGIETTQVTSITPTQLSENSSASEQPASSPQV